MWEEELAALVTRDAMTGIAKVIAARVTLLDLDSGPAAPPRCNGELVFAEPWESRAFGLAVTLHDRRAFEWEDFRQATDRGRGPGRGGRRRGWSYYSCWLEALERLLATEGMVAAGDIEDRVGQLAGRPAGHDHDTTTSTEPLRAPRPSR